MLYAPCYEIQSRFISQHKSCVINLKKKIEISDEGSLGLAPGTHIFLGDQNIDCLVFHSSLPW